MIKYSIANGDLIKYKQEYSHVCIDERSPWVEWNFPGISSAVGSEVQTSMNASLNDQNSISERGKGRSGKVIEFPDKILNLKDVENFPILPALLTDCRCQTDIRACAQGGMPGI